MSSSGPRRLLRSIRFIKGILFVSISLLQQLDGQDADDARKYCAVRVLEICPATDLPCCNLRVDGDDTRCGRAPDYCKEATARHAEDVLRVWTKTGSLPPVS